MKANQAWSCYLPCKSTFILHLSLSHNKRWTVWSEGVRVLSNHIFKIYHLAIFGQRNSWIDRCFCWKVAGLNVNSSVAVDVRMTLKWRFKVFEWLKKMLTREFRFNQNKRGCAYCVTYFSVLFLSPGPDRKTPKYERNFVISPYENSDITNSILHYQISLGSLYITHLNM